MSTILLKACLFLTITYWVANETGPVTLFAMGLLLAYILVQEYRIAGLESVIGPSVDQKRLSEHLDKERSERMGCKEWQRETEFFPTAKT
jgi:hypothetical protein